MPSRRRRGRWEQRLSLAGLCVLSATATAIAQQPQPAPAAAFPNLVCTGLFAKDTDHARLTAAFGAGNVTFEEVPGPEGTTEKATVLFGKDPKRRLEVSWHDEANRARPVLIAIQDKSTWVGPKGLKVGMPLAEVERLNGKPFKLTGFDWDLGGHAGFGDGAFGQVPGDCAVSARFLYTVNLPPKRMEPISGDQEVSSDHPSMRASKPKVTAVYVGYGE